MTKKHVLIMLLCCLAPLVAIGAILLFKIPASQALLVIMVLLCPLSHLLMMKFMVHDEAQMHDRAHEHHPAGHVAPEAKTHHVIQDKT